MSTTARLGIERLPSPRLLLGRLLIVVGGCLIPLYIMFVPPSSARKEAYANAAAARATWVAPRGDLVARLAFDAVADEVAGCLENQGWAKLHAGFSPEDMEANCIRELTKERARRDPKAAAGFVEIARRAGMKLPDEYRGLSSDQASVEAFLRAAAADDVTERVP